MHHNLTINGEDNFKEQLTIYLSIQEIPKWTIFSMTEWTKYVSGFLYAIFECRIQRAVIFMHIGMHMECPK